MIKRANNFAVCCMNMHAGEIRYLYEGIKTIEDAETLSQYAMSRKMDDEIIIIIPRSNISINNFTEYFDNASKLANKYLSDDRRIHQLGPVKRLRGILNALSTIINIDKCGGEVEVCKKRN